jgi:hypothetical protein
MIALDCAASEFTAMEFTITQNLKVIKEQREMQKNRLLILRALSKNIQLTQLKTACQKMTGMAGNF